MTEINFESVFDKKTSKTLFKPTKNIKNIVALNNVKRKPFVDQVFKLIDGRAFIAGSAGLSLLEGISDKPFNDIDIFFIDAKSCKNTYDKLLKKKFKVLDTSSESQIQMKSDDFPHIISLVKHRYFDSVIDCLDSFDFTVAQVAITPKEIWANKYTLEDAKNGFLCVHSLSHSGDWLGRLTKYIKKGYEPSIQCLNEIEDFVSKKEVQKYIPKKKKNAVGSILDVVEARTTAARGAYPARDPSNQPQVAAITEVNEVVPAASFIRPVASYTNANGWYTMSSTTITNNDNNNNS